MPSSRSSSSTKPCTRAFSTRPSNGTVLEPWHYLQSPDKIRDDLPTQARDKRKEIAENFGKWGLDVVMKKGTRR